jgi:tetratricopeptide (TPR) repeat protein
LKRLTQRKASERKRVSLSKKKPVLRRQLAREATRRTSGPAGMRGSGRRELQARSGERHNGDAEYATAIRSFEMAARHFQRQRYDKAKELFESLATTAPPGVADRAKIHLRLCEQRLSPATRPLRTPEDYYVAGVSELNARRLERAVEFLAKASKMDPKREETHYALAAAYALQGKADAAIAHLTTSIQLRPQNVYQARRDEDLHSLTSDPRFSHLVHPEHTLPTREDA